MKRSYLHVVLCLVALASCTSASTVPIDPSGQLSREDYLALRDRVPQEGTSVPAAEPPIPDLPFDLAPLPTQEDPLHTKLVSISVSEKVSVRDILQELAREAKVNLELDPRISTPIIFTAHNQPFDDVLRRICRMANLRMIRDQDYIRIVPDEPYQETYQLDYLSLSRKANSETSIATNVFDVDVTNGASGAGNSAGSNGGRSGSGVNDNNSTSRVTASSETDLWGEVERTLRQIMTSSVPQQDKESGASFSIDKQAGMITVFGTSRQQEAVANYLKKLKRKAYSQVLIDARIIEVELNDSFRSGVNWRSLFDSSTNLAARFGVAAAGGPYTTATTATDGVFTASIRNGDFAGILNFVRGFGTTRVLSSPRLTVLNNQTAVLKVATNQVYFVTQAQFTTVTNANGSAVTTTPVYTSTPRTVPVGLVMTVQPAIDADHNRVTMTLRPTISRVVDQVNDPSIGLNAAQAGVSAPVESKIPVLAVREMDSVIRLKSGEVAVMGGLMQDSSMNQENGVPWLDALPMVGDLAKSRDNDGRTTELVILLRATVTDGASPDEADGNLYNDYTKDPRPLPVQHRKKKEASPNKKSEVAP